MDFELFNFNKGVTMVGDVESGEGWACVEIEMKWETLYLPFNFAVNLKLLWKSLNINQ